MRRLSSTDIDTSLSIENMEPSIAISIATKDIRRFLNDKIKGGEVDVILSTLRKGSWMIDDFLKIQGFNIAHYYIGQKIQDEKLKGKRIVIFDDSIHTGKSIISDVTKAKEFGTVKVVCIAINDEAINTIKENNVKVDYLKKFEKYVAYGDQGELLPDCQGYYYAYFMIPYISNLGVNYSPDYVSLTIMIKGGSVKEMDNITRVVMGSINDLNVDCANEIDCKSNTKRTSVDIGTSYLEKYIAEELETKYEADISKLRVSVSIYDGYSEIVITPMLCPICDDISGIDMVDLPFYLSKKFISEVCSDIMHGLESAGYEIIKKHLIAGIIDARSV